MKIERATLLLDSSHDAFRRSQSEVWVRPVESAGADFAVDIDTVNISQAARSSLAREVATTRDGIEPARHPDLENVDQEVDNDPLLVLVKAMIELLTGRPVTTFSARELSGPSTTPASPDVSPSARQFTVTRRRISDEHESTRFVAKGWVQTADGRDLKFELQMEMERRFHSESTLETSTTKPRKDPLVLNFAGAPAALLDTEFVFDIDDDGALDTLPMLARGSGFLVFDHNGNGVADSAGELFGPRSDDGFGELAELDQDANGWIDAADPAYQRLGVWQPTADGPGRVVPLAELGIGALGLENLATPFSLRNAANAELGAVRKSGIALGEDGRAYGIQELVLTRNP